MNIVKLLAPIVLGIALALGACAGGENTDEAAAPDEGAAEESANAGADHDPTGYVIDRSENMDVEEADIDALNERLASVHADTGHDIHIYTLRSDGRPVQQIGDELLAEGDADAAIILSGRDITIAGEGMDDDFDMETGGAMIERFRQGDMRGGLNVAIDRVVERLGS